jgi:hypothetical protein
VRAAVVAIRASHYGSRVNRLALAASSLVIVSACNSEAPPRGPEETCAKSCEVRANKCTQQECWRGCNLVLDRLAEHEGDRVIACVAAAGAPCSEHAWARCATRVGPHEDGGPPAPPPPSDVEDLDQE